MSSESSLETLLSQLETSEVNHYPLIGAFAEKINLIETINAQVPSAMDVDAGTLVLGLVIDTLSGRSPLYHLQSFFEHQDMELLFGRPLEASAFNDDAIGRLLDRLFKTGAHSVYLAVCKQAMEAFPIRSSHVHFDTTSVNVFGDYRGSDSESSPFKMTHGYSKDKRPDLKQFMYGMLCIGGNIPILGETYDGNSSDKTLNNELLSRISKHLGEFGISKNGFVYVADSALVTQANLEQLADIYFITRLPASYAQHDEVIARALENSSFTEIGSLSEEQTFPNRPTASYKIAEETVTLYGSPYRAVVVHSSAHDKRRHKRLERELNEAQKETDDFLKPWKKREFFCKADAEVAMKEISAFYNRYYQLNPSLKEKPIYARGRLKAGQPRQVREVRYLLNIERLPKQEVIDRRTMLAGCFVMLTNLPQAEEMAHSGQEVLSAYKEQYGVEKNFSFIKDDAIVNSIFLKKPERIEALGIIFLISLLLWRLIESQMRNHCRITQTPLKGWDNKPTMKPTAYMLIWKFKGISVLRIKGQRRLAQPLSSNQLQFLSSIGLSETVFLQKSRAG